MSVATRVLVRSAGGSVSVVSVWGWGWGWVRAGMLAGGTALSRGVGCGGGWWGHIATEGRVVGVGLW